MANSDFVDVRVDGDDIPAAPEIGGVNAGAVNGASNAAAGATATAANPAGTAFTGAPDVSAPRNLSDFIRRYDSLSVISNAGRQFLQDLTAALTDQTKNSAHTYWNGISVVQLTRPNDSCAVICNGYAVILIMAESNFSMNNVPVVHNELLAVEDLRRFNPTIEVAKVVVVDTNDYSNVANYAKSIRNVFASIFMPEKPTIDHLFDTNITVSDNPEDYTIAYKMLSPHTVPLRRDLTLTVYSQARNQGQNNPQNWNQQHEQEYYWSSPDLANRDVLATIGGYVEVVRNVISYNGTYRYLPIIHISEIQSAVVADEMLPVYIVLAVNRWLFSNAWHEYFKRQTLDEHGHPVNIGYYFPNPKNDCGRAYAETEDEFYNVVYEHFEPAQIVLDVVEGRFSIPGIWKLTSKDVSIAQQVTNSYMAFFNNRIMPYQGGMPYMVSDVQYRGTYEYGTKPLDTAYIDFMSEFLKHPTEALKCEKLLLRKANPIAAIMDQRQFEPNLKLLYRTDVVAFVPGFIMWLSSNMPGLNMFSNGQNTGLADVNGIAANAKAWGEYMNSPQYSGYSMNPFFNTTDVIYQPQQMPQG